MELNTLLLLSATLFVFVACEDWAHHTVLDGNGRYHLYWTPPPDQNPESEIVFKVEVEAKGFVGFGLSPNGGMTGADIVTGWVKNGRKYFQDRHGIGKTLPEVDDSQDWKLLKAAENRTHTILKFSRKLDTCDEDDMVIDDSTMRLIFAFSDKDPRGKHPFYHSKNRGTKSTMLLQGKSRTQPSDDVSSLLYWDIRSPDVDISSQKTLYWCKIFKSPDLSTKHHIVRAEPLIQEGHEEFIHHMLLYECVGGTDEEYQEHIDYQGHVCYHPNMPDAMKKCDGVTVGWAIGGKDLVFPDHVGLPLEPAPGRYYMFEMHYDNPMAREGIIDHSGLRIYYTPDLRQYDSGCLMLGSAVSPRVFVPPEQPHYEVTGHSNPECLDPEMPEGGIKALGVLLHAHLLGRGLKVRHFRGNEELPPLAIENNYDFNYQEYRYKDEVEILPGDQITVECTYDSSGRDQVTFGGLSTEEEMCLAFILYYPRINRFSSLSAPTYSAINEALHTNFTDIMSVYSLLEYDWNNVNVEEVGEHLKNAEHSSFCSFGNGDKGIVKSLISYPSDLKTYVPDDSICKEG